MSLLSFIVVLIVAGVALYLVNALIPMDPKFKTVINAVVGVVLAIVAIYWLAGFLGWDGNIRGGNGCGPPPAYRR